MFSTSVSNAVASASWFEFSVRIRGALRLHDKGLRCTAWTDTATCDLASLVHFSNSLTSEPTLLIRFHSMSRNVLLRKFEYCVVHGSQQFNPPGPPWWQNMSYERSGLSKACGVQTNSRASRETVVGGGTLCDAAVVVHGISIPDVMAFGSVLGLFSLDLGCFMWHGKSGDKNTFAK